MSTNPKLIMERIDDSLPLPKYQTAGAAGIDLYLREDVTLQPGERGFFPANVKMAIPQGFYVAVKSRSSSFKLGINIFAGTIDSDYHKEVRIGIENVNSTEVKLEKGQRVAQALLQKVEQAQIEEQAVEDNDRGGFGSTGS